MKILSIKVTNFGSYPELEFNFDNQGLCLVSGSTGAGKSTLMDTVSWCIYGVTAKNGSVEDVRSWKSEGEATAGVCLVQLRDQVISVTRVRGVSSQNDLFWRINDQEPTRGKDLNDTQRLLEARLGVTADQFLASSYLHEFSSVGTFFTSNVKARRALLEGLTDLSLPVKLADALSGAKKGSRVSLDRMESERERLFGKLEQLQESESATKEQAEIWRKSQKEKIKDLKAKAETYEACKEAETELNRSKHNEWGLARLESFIELEITARRLKEIVKEDKQFAMEEIVIRDSTRCDQCGSLPNNLNEVLIDCRERRTKNTSYSKELQSTLREIKALKDAQNPYPLDKKSEFINDFNSLLKEAEEAKNPFDDQYSKLQIMICNTNDELDEVKANIASIEGRISALSHLYDLSFALRGELLRKAIIELQDSTNAYLEKYFDAEIRIGFELKDADTLDVTIHKSGYQCNFKQLSRGQRALLRLTFGISVMKASANQTGYHPNVIMLDEVLDAMDVDLKMKAVSLFEQLSTEHDTVLVIDHATEVKNSFNKNYSVELIGDESVISEQ